MSFGYKTDKGMTRKINEDRLLVRNLPSSQVLAVADGMGGHNAGDVASSLAIGVLEEYPFLEMSLKEIEDVLGRANQVIYDKALKNPEFQGMGTTLTLCLIKGDRIMLGHVGDSRAYLTTSNNGFQRLTNDHSLVNELIKIKEITEEEGLRHPFRHILSQALGTEPNIQIDCQEFTMVQGSILLLCTDGLTNEVPEDEMEEILRKYDPQQAAEKLVEKANAYGGQDNITVIVFSNDKG